MGCNSCGGGASSGVTYPYEAVLVDGSKVMVSSAAQHRTENEKARMRLRQQAGGGSGYTARSA